MQHIAGGYNNREHVIMIFHDFFYCFDMFSLNVIYDLN